MNDYQKWYIDTGLDIRGLAVGIETSECGITATKFTEVMTWLADLSEATELAVDKSIQDPLVAMLKAIGSQVLEKANSP